MSERTAAPYYDPYDPEIDRDPHPVWKRLRDEAPLYHNEQHDFYALSRFADVLAASLDWQTYSSARGTVLEMMDTTPIEPGESPGEGWGMMIFMDPPRHDVLRRLVSRAFTPRRVAEREERIRELCAQFLDPVGHGDELDYVEDFAAKIPAMVIGSLLGVPKEDQDRLRIWGDLMMRYEPEGTSPEKAEAVANLQAYLAAIVEDRMRTPRDDMVSDLLAAEITLEDGARRRLEWGEVMSFFALLQLAGSETTARLLGWAAVLLARHPDERRKLVADPGLVPNGVEELLRYEAPSPIQARFVTRDVQWYGQKVPINSKLALLTGSAGRDEREYPDPDRFDVERRFDRHVTFGYGIHYCLGANLARLEGRVVLEETLARFPEWEVDEARVEMVRTSTVRGPAHVPVRVSRRAG
ncbi:MAG: cytochrome P450 [Acidimicrobiia bacterium]|nr:MAG: cytochrome P450 [Acidimicrobiia bacterium]